GVTGTKRRPVIRVGSEAVLLEKFDSPMPKTLTVLVTDVGASGAAFTVNVMGGYAPPGATTSAVRVQLISVCGPGRMEQVQPAPLAELAIKPTGIRSSTIRFLPPPVETALTLVIVIVYDAGCPAVKSPMWDSAMARSGKLILVASLAV